MAFFGLEDPEDFGQFRITLYQSALKHYTKENLVEKSDKIGIVAGKEIAAGRIMWFERIATDNLN